MFFDKLFKKKTANITEKEDTTKKIDQTVDAAPKINYVHTNQNSEKTVTVLKSMDELTAITKYDGQFSEAIKVISMKTYLEKKAKEIQKAKLIRKMKEEMEIAKLEETLRKHSEDTSEMSKLYSQYKSLFEE